MGRIIQRMLKIGTWHLVVITVLAAEGLTALTLLIASEFVWQRVSLHLLAIGMMVSTVAALALAPVLMHLARAASKLGIEKEYLEREVEVRRRADAALRKSEKKYRALIESTDDSVYLVDRGLRYLYINRRHLDRLGIRDGQYSDKSYADFHGPEATAAFAEHVAAVFATGESRRYEASNPHSGTHCQLTLSPVLGDGGGVEAVTVISADITRRKLMEEELRALSLTDPLTQLHNRRGFMTLAEQQLRVAYRLGKRVTVVYADLDGLKKINDTLGHNHGDLAIMEAAQLIRRTFREADIVARMGGDEFAALLIESSAESDAVLLNRLARNIEMHNAERRTPFTLAVSAGVSHYDGGAAYSIEDIIDEADRRMYEMKHAHKEVSS